MVCNFKRSFFGLNSRSTKNSPKYDSDCETAEVGSHIGAFQNCHIWLLFQSVYGDHTETDIFYDEEKVQITSNKFEYMNTTK